MRTTLPLPVAFAFLAAAVAGCLTEPQPLDVDPDMGLDEVSHYLLDEFPVDLDHDHANATLHGSTFGVGFTSYTACTADGSVASAVGGYTDIAFHEQFAFVGNSRGFCILDVTDPTKPTFVAQYEGEQASDLEVTADGNYAFLLTQRNRATSLTDPMGNPTASLPRGVIVVNVQDKTRPTFESYYPVPTNGVHTATAYLHGSRQILFVQSYDWVPPGEVLPSGVNPPVPQENAPLTQRVEITELAPTGGKMVLKRLSTWSLARPTDQPFELYFPHDSFAQKHPLTGDHLLYIAYWDAGLVILNVNDPSNPTMVSRYGDIAPSIYNQYHDVKAFDHAIAGRHITVTGPEIPAGPEAGVVRIFDTSDPGNPVQLGTWRLPENPGTPGGFLFSPHVFTLHDGFIFIGHNHGGVWIIDVNDKDLLREPQTAGFFFPRGDEATKTWSKTSSVWGAYVHDGFVYATEGTSGVHVLKMLGQRPPPKESEAEHGHPCPPHDVAVLC